jgi:bifunctional DNA-binding transcriptional regulator/antitoxin component of YhaV-PrlF toxin-antitoxin module
VNYTAIVKQLPDESLYIDLPPELLAELGWDENTELVWIIQDDGRIILREENDSSNEA